MPEYIGSDISDWLAVVQTWSVEAHTSWYVEIQTWLAEVQTWLVEVQNCLMEDNRGPNLCHGATNFVDGSPKLVGEDMVGRGPLTWVAEA